MLISAFQKSTLLDYPGKLACLVFTYGCNLRCEYCHNPELVIQPFRKNMAVSEEEIFSFLKKRKRLLQDKGVRCIQELLDILDLDIVDYWAMDVKYEKEIYIQNLKDKIGYDEIERSIALIKGKARDYEFRTTYVKGIHTIDSVKGIGQLISGSKRYYIQNFRPGKTINPTLNSTNSFSQEELEKFKRIMKKYVESVEIR